MQMWMILKTYEELSELRETYKDKKIVFSSGTFDLTHAGHILFFEDCKKYGDILVVAIGEDSICKKYKGDTRPILNEYIRLKTVDSLKPVDYSLIVRATEFSPLYPLSISAFPRLFDRLKPDKWVVNRDALDIPMRQELANKYNIELIILERYCPVEFEGISTTKLIEKIKKLQ